MISSACLISIPHSGTQFLIQALRRVGFGDIGINAVFNASYSRAPTLYQGHCVKATQTEFAIELSKHIPLIIPLRHPYRVEESWKRRDLDMHQMQNAYMHMLVLGKQHPVFVPIDAAPAIRALSHCKLNDALDTHVPMDWDEVVGSEHGTAHVPLSDLDPSEEMVEICNHPLITEFYDHDHDHH